MKRLVASLFRPQYVLVWVFLAMVAYFCVEAPSFRSASNLIHVVKSSSVIAVMVLGLTWIVASGEIDVSFPSVAGLASVVTAMAIKHGVPWAVAPFIAIAAGTVFGLFSGYLIAAFRCPSLIATIAIGSIATGVACIMAEGRPVRLASTVGIIETLGSGGMGVQLAWIAIVGGYIWRSNTSRTIPPPVSTSTPWARTAKPRSRPESARRRSSSASSACRRCWPRAGESSGCYSTRRASREWKGRYLLTE